MTTRRLWAGLSILMVAISSHAAEAPKITHLKGSVLYSGPGKKPWHKLTQDSAIEQGGRVIVGKDSGVSFTFDGKEVRVWENTRFIVTQLSAPGEAYELGLNKGYLWASVNPKNGRHFRIRTRSAVLGVRGTMFSAIESEKGTLTCVCKGRVHVVSGSQEAEVKEGGGMSVTRDGNASKPAYAKIMVSGRPTAEFMKSTEEDHRFKRCLYCHNDSFKMGQR
ncbi:MAG: FecR domain-containing protein [Bdellovibrionales bacterium]|nr:FecR domain-containing protein [Bdellovibrionales bacterium]